MANRQGAMAKRQLGIGFILLAGLGYLTWQRAQVYASDEALWRDTGQKNPRAWDAPNNLACNLAERGGLGEAGKHFTRSLELNPNNAQAHRNLGKALTLRGKFSEAEPHFRTALELRPDDTDALAAYADGLAQTQRHSEALALLSRAGAIKPTISLRRQLVPLLLAAGKHAEAIKELREILAQQPDAPEELNNLAWLLATSPAAENRNGPEAVRLAQRAGELTQHQQPMPLGTLAAAYAEAGDFTNAVKTAQLAIDRATVTGEEAFARMNQQLLRLYRTQRPFHMPGPK
jgi:protein O-mannosyl-transferase